jgi:hypothetical protein
MSKFLHIRSTKFPILPGERAELVNDNMYGKSLAEYLQVKLRDRGHDARFACCEDWGWWVEMKNAPFAFVVCIYAKPAQREPIDFACTDGAAGPKQWSWRCLRFIDTSPWAHQLRSDLLAIFQADQDVEIVGVSEAFPF